MRTFAAVGAVLFLATACDAGAGETASQAAGPAANNTAEICESAGKSTRDIVLALPGKLVEPNADIGVVYQETFGTMADELAAAAAKATDPAMATMLNNLAAESDKIAVSAATDPENVDPAGLTAAIEKLETFCPSDGSSPGASPRAAAPGGVVGAADSGCPMPVTFEVTPKWKPKSVKIDKDDPLAELARTGPYTLICEVDGKPAGHIGFLRVWLDEAAPNDLKAAVQPFLKKSKNRKVTYEPVGADALDVSYEVYQELFEEYVKRRVYAKRLPAGVVVLELGGLSTEDHEANLPTYDLAVRTLTVGS